MLNLLREHQIVFQQWLHSFTFPTTMLGRFQFLANLVTTCFLLLLVCLFILILVDVTCHLVVILMLISLMTSDIEHLFTCLLAICILFFGGNTYSSLIPILKLDCLYFCCWVIRVLIYSGYYSLIRQIICKSCSQICDL